VPGPISHVVDEEERYLVSEDGTEVFDRVTAHWTQFDMPVEPVEPLFWQNGSLYLSHSHRIEGDPEVEIYRYRMGEDSAQYVCHFRALDWEFGVAHGHHFPYIYLYQATDSPLGPMLSIYSVDVRDCGIRAKFDFKEPIDGPVLDVWRFERLNSIAVQVDHPTKSFLWESPRFCRYFDLQRATPLVPSYDLPYVATWTKKDGISLFNLATQKKGRLLQGMPFEPLSQDDVRLARRGDRLFLSPTVEGEEERSLLELTLSKSFRN
jgi:hypothetical protein